jgi:uncharacterized protein (DUF302 family)
MNTDPDSGIVTFRSAWPFDETVKQIETALSARKIKLFARIDQAVEAASVGLALRPTVLLIFGNPSQGTPLMESYPTLAIDLPLKALIWEANPSEVYVNLTSPEFLRKRHGLPSAPFSQVIELFASLIET